MARENWNATGVLTSSGERVTASAKDEANNQFWYTDGAGNEAKPAPLSDFVRDPVRCEYKAETRPVCGDVAVWRSTIMHTWYCDEHSLPETMREECAVCGSPSCWQESARDERWLCFDHAPKWAGGRGLETGAALSASA